MPDTRRRYVLESVYEQHFKQWNAEIRCSECKAVLYETDTPQNGGVKFDSGALDRMPCGCPEAAGTRRMSPADWDAAPYRLMYPKTAEKPATEEP